MCELFVPVSKTADQMAGFLGRSGVLRLTWNLQLHTPARVAARSHGPERAHSGWQPKVSMFRRAAQILLTALGFAIISSAAQAAKVPPGELVSYIQEAKRRGVQDAAIRRETIAAGWPSSAVDAAIAYTNSNPSPARPPAGNPAASAVRSGPQNAGAPGSLVSPESLGIPDDYYIGAGDMLQIAVWKEPDVTVPSVVVRPDGMITVPLIKELEVAGMTPRQAERTIAERLGKFITDPNVTVVVAASHSKKVYVVGGVRREGPLPYTYRMTVLQALSEVGGLTDYAKRKQIYVIRNEGGKEYRLDFNYDEVIRGERMEQNLPLLPGDTLVIPR